ncbi:MAG: lipopolysaccharide heptosyltransferase II [Zoogloeaceae bacterium]|jgi:heptosyltransferase-2|nr:lipopolysaccharide heptosyltransferase II [Zoogloeaceae bacterium]
MRALIIAPSWIGDAIMAQPLFARLIQRTPELELEALAPAWVAPVLSRMPEITRTRVNPFGHGVLAWRQRRALGKELAREGFTRAYVLPNSLKSALVPFFSGIPERIGFTGECRYGLVNVRHRLDKTALPLMVERFAQLAEAPGAALQRPLPSPRLVSTLETQAAALAHLQLEAPARLAVFCPGAEYGAAKRWPTEHFAALARMLAQEGMTVWLLGSRKDHPIGEAIAASSAGVARNLCGATDMTEAIDLIAQAALVVCNDSGLMHVAAALDRPTVALFGSSSPGFTPPLSSKARVVSRELPCSPCFKRECPQGHLDCLRGLMPEKVLRVCQQSLVTGE